MGNRVNFISYGTGYCEVCLQHGQHIFIGYDEYKVICKGCLPEVMERMKDMADLLKPEQKKV